jgi:hypothetical protein
MSTLAGHLKPEWPYLSVSNLPVCLITIICERALSLLASSCVLKEPGSWFMIFEATLLNKTNSYLKPTSTLTYSLVKHSAEGLL